MKRRVLWVPGNADGSRWWAWYAGRLRGHVTMLHNGNCVVFIRGCRARRYVHSMRMAGKQLVAFVNAVSPKSIP